MLVLFFLQHSHPMEVLNLFKIAKTYIPCSSKSDTGDAAVGNYVQSISNYLLTVLEDPNLMI
jgi:hypothetical protein